ncbi:hypothetical protein ACFX10_028581 [Malus domestica]
MAPKISSDDACSLGKAAVWNFQAQYRRVLVQCVLKSRSGMGYQRFRWHSPCGGRLRHQHFPMRGCCRGTCYPYRFAILY